MSGSSPQRASLFCLSQPRLLLQVLASPCPHNLHPPLLAIHCNGEELTLNRKKQESQGLLAAGAAVASCSPASTPAALSAAASAGAALPSSHAAGLNSAPGTCCSPSCAMACRKSGGTGERTVRGSPVRGCVMEMATACRACRPIQGPAQERPGRGLPSIVEVGGCQAHFEQAPQCNRAGV